jgi:hypothetical protein
LSVKSLIEGDVASPIVEIIITCRGERYGGL